MSRNPIYSNNKTMLALFTVEDTEIQNLQDSVDSVLDQFFIETATDTIDRWEKEVGITYSALPLEQRRAAVKSKLRGYGTVTVSHIKNICDAFTNGNVDVIERPSDYAFDIKFNSIMGIPPNMSDLQKVIEQIKPAHLGVTYIYMFNTNQILSQFTHQQLGGFTHDQLRNEAVI